jgi:hypothetical protein
MPQLQPMPLFLNETAEANRGTEYDERSDHARAPVLAAVAVNRYPRSAIFEAERTS